MKNKKSHRRFDVFISYRRETGADDARLLQQALKARGYNVFFDFDSLRDGKFDQKIFDAIDEAPVFILMLTKGVLDKCTNENDWVRQEIERAIEKRRVIVPVQPSDNGFAYPDQIPDDIKSLRRVQNSELNKGSLFEESVDKIIKDRFPRGVHGKKIKSSSKVSKRKGKNPKSNITRDPPISLYRAIFVGRYYLYVENRGHETICIKGSVRIGGESRVISPSLIDGDSDILISGKLGWGLRPGDHGTIKVVGWVKPLKFTIDEDGEVTYQ